MATRIKLRRDTAANWTTTNPILAAGETGFETDTRMMKLGDGSTRWADLKYCVTGDMRISGTTIASDTDIKFSSHSGLRENWALTVNALSSPTDPIEAWTDAVAYDSMGNAFVAGWYLDQLPTTSVKYSGAFLMKVDPTGQVLWNNYYNEYTTYGWGVSVDHNGDAVLILSEIDGPSSDIVMIKVHGTTGVPMWQRYIASIGDYDDFATSIDIDANNDIFITGWTGADGINTGNETFLIAKISGIDGTFNHGGWQKMLSANIGCNTELGWGIAVDPSGDVCIVGSGQTFGDTFIPVVKRIGATGGVAWQTRILDQISWNGNIYTNTEVYGTDVTSDSQGDFYVTWWGLWNGDGPGFPGTQCGVTKLSGVDGSLLWSRQIGHPDYLSVSGSIVCDSDDNIYVHSTIENYQSQSDSENNNYNNDPRFNSVIVKFNAQGTVVWKRTLHREQYTTFSSVVPGYLPLPGGQTVAVNDEYLLIGGTQFITLDYAADQNWYNQPFLVQVDKAGTEFSVDGWHFKASPDFPVILVTPVVDSQHFFDDMLSFTGTLTNENAVDVFYEPNMDTTDLSYRIMPRAETMTFDGGKLTLPKGGSIDVGREKIGYITSVGNFDGTEGGNTEGDVWFNGVVRDAQGGSYAVGAWRDYQSFNEGPSNRNVPLTVKFDNMGQIVWQASDTLDYWAGAIDVMIDPITSNPVVLSLDNNYDGSEGFTVKTLDANSGQVVGDIMHIMDEGHDQYLWARNLALMSDGTPVVVGYINSNRDEYLNVTNGGAGSTGSNATNILVIPKSVFVRGRYPTTNGLWYITNTDPYVYASIIEVDYFDNGGPGFTATNVSSTGTGATFIVNIDPTTNAYSLTVGSSGSGYQDGDTLLIASEVFLPTAGLGDVAFTVTTDGMGSVTTATTTSTSSWANIELQINNSVDFTTATSTLKVYEETGDDGFIWTPNWSTAVGAQTGTDYFHSLALDTDDNIIAGGYYNQTGLPNTTQGSPFNTNWPQTSMLVKYSSTGTQQWSVCLDGSEGYGKVTGIVTDPDNNIYAMKSVNSSNYLLKLDPTGSMLWQVNIGSAQMGGGDHGIAIDSDRNILIGGQYGGQYNYEYNAILLNKIDTDGNLLWTRQIYSPTGNINNGYNDDYRNAIDIHGDRFSVIAYSSAVGDNSYQGFYADLPLDGSGTGNHGDYIYEEVEYSIDRTTDNQVTAFTAETRPHTFTSTNETNVLTIYADRQTKIETVYDDMGGEITSVSKIVFEDGTEQSSSAQDIPQVDISRVNSQRYYTLRIEDRGHHVYSGIYWNWSYIVVPRNSYVAFPIGTAITIVSGDYDVVIGAGTPGDTLIYGAGTGDYNDGWWIPARSMATLLKIEQDVWMLAGAGLGTGRYL
jgi:hypothetical protein